ncbi:DUF1484 family protein [Cupriavidus pinatubonensis]|uniref:DUF1484 domain-containing protein n=1 Tax=Cupriavidus pinatubonensis TaxID=248026 RepID=A0ABN7YIK9_9BURK|nr:DUF1484 family protein [Cupriavidus pinatubonensis]CAG9172171.1 hypothetical protein LMG23994_02336 [Cupriavidus pinatubonensis]
MPVSLTKVEANDPTLLESISAGLHGVLALLETASERSEDCYAAHCLLAMLKARLDNTLQTACEAC